MVADEYATCGGVALHTRRSASGVRLVAMRRTGGDHEVELAMTEGGGTLAAPSASIRKAGNMAGSADHIKALVRSHAAGDDAAFYSVASQIAAQAARSGHTRVAQDIKQAIDASRRDPVALRLVTGPRVRDDLAQLVNVSYPDVSLRDLVGPPRLLDQVHRILAEQRQRVVLTEQGFPPVHRLLLEGPPGTGKTMTAAVLAHELSLPLLEVRLDSLMSKFMGETASKIRTVFEAAETQRAVYLFDEFDALGGERAGNDVGEARRVLNSFLVFLEQVSAQSIIVAATNHIRLLDRALFRRFDMTVHYQVPDATEAAVVMKARLGPMSKGVRWPAVTKRATGLSHAELVKAAEEAAKQAILEGRDRVDAPLLVEALKARQTPLDG